MHAGIIGQHGWEVVETFVEHPVWYLGDPVVTAPVHRVVGVVWVGHVGELLAELQRTFEVTGDVTHSHESVLAPLDQQSQLVVRNETRELLVPVHGMEQVVQELQVLLMEHRRVVPRVTPVVRLLEGEAVLMLDHMGVIELDQINFGALEVLSLIYQEHLVRRTVFHPETVQHLDNSHTAPASTSHA